MKNIMLNFCLLLIAGSVIVHGMSIDTFFTDVYHSIHFNTINITIQQLDILLNLLNLQTGVPANNFDITTLTDLINIVSGTHYVLGYLNVNGVLIYAVKIGNYIYSVEPRVFTSFIFWLI
jgi:hypothetical protein